MYEAIAKKALFSVKHTIAQGGNAKFATYIMTGNYDGLTMAEIKEADKFVGDRKAVAFIETTDGKGIYAFLYETEID